MRLNPIQQRKKRVARWRRCLIGGLVALPLAIAAYGYWEATLTPVVRHYEVRTPLWPDKVAPVRIALLTDIHAASPDMPASRLREIVAQVNRLHPDLVVLTGDFVSDKALNTSTVSTADAIRPLSGLRAQLGVYAVLGNHDWWRNGPGIIAELRRAHIQVLENGHARVGPVAVAGLADVYTRSPAIDAALSGAPAGVPIILLSHSPDVFPAVPPTIALTLAGHTHGGQIVLPQVGPIATASRYGKRYAYGHIIEGGRHLIVGSGLGTSILPIRIGRPPEIVVVKVGPAGHSPGRKSGTDK